MRRFISRDEYTIGLRPTRVSPARLLELDRILTRDYPPKAVVIERDPESVPIHLADVPDERIARFTQALRSGHDDFTDNDDVDLLTMRLLLNDFITAVGHLRAVTEIAGSLIDDAGETVRKSQRFLTREEHREEKMRSQQSASGGPADR